MARYRSSSLLRTLEGVLGNVGVDLDRLVGHRDDLLAVGLGGRLERHQQAGDLAEVVVGRHHGAGRGLGVAADKWYISPAVFILSVFSKPLSAMFFPMTLFLIYRSEFSTRKKVLIALFYIAIIAGTASILLSVTTFSGTIQNFDALKFWTGFTTWYFQLRLDGLVLLFLLPLTVGLFMISRKGIREADSILFLIGGILLSAPILAAFTGFNIEPYRYIPLIVFFAVGVGMLLSKKIIPQA